jgi:hypothetical protein
MMNWSNIPAAPKQGRAAVTKSAAIARRIDFMAGKSVDNAKILKSLQLVNWLTCIFSLFQGMLYLPAVPGKIDKGECDIAPLMDSFWRRPYIQNMDHTLQHSSPVIVAGLGRLGLRLVQILRERGQEVRVITDATVQPWHERQAREAGAELFIGDFRDPEVWVRAGVTAGTWRLPSV